MKQYLEQRLYEPIQESEEKLRIFVVGDLESLSASVMYTFVKFNDIPMYGSSDNFGKLSSDGKSLKIGSDSLRTIGKTEYLPLFEDEKFVVGETHHSKGLGKLKVYDKEKDVEYGVPFTDIINESLKDWRIDKK